MARVDQQFVCDRELFSELTEPPIVQQTVSERELFSELAKPHSLMYEIGSFFHSSLKPRSIRCY